ncbi:MAG: elongation factor G [Chloroflexi bacterium]|nr:elongation factor G [Chloroflexota bacterium]
MTPLTSGNIRNVALLSHSGTGKTTLAEAMLYATGALSRMGRVEDGNTTSDYEPEEIKRRTSLQTAIVPCLWKDTKINLIDTPGYADYRGEAISGIRVADGAVLVVAAPSGVEVGTEEMWQMAEDRRMPRFIFINKMDRENADFQRAMRAIVSAFGKKCVAINIPIGAQSTFKSVIDLFHPAHDIPNEVKTQVDAAKARLTEAVAETDDDLATKFLEGEELSHEEMIEGLRHGVSSGEIVPVMAGSATLSIGVRELMDAINNFIPPPEKAPTLEVNLAGRTEKESLQAKPDGHLAALVFKTIADPYVGKLSYFRVYSGTIRSDSQVWNANKEQLERIGQVFTLRGKSQEQLSEVVAGDIGAVSKLSYTSTGDTLCNKEYALRLDSPKFPEPTYSMAVHPKTKADVDKMTSSLGRLAEEDPSMHIYRNPNTGEMLLSGLGDSHVEVAIEKLKRKFGSDLQIAPPKVAYKETITMSTRVEYKHKKQTGGHGQYGHVFLELEPQTRGAGFEFGDKVVGGSVPREYIPAVEKGVVKALQEGVLAGYPIVDIKAVIYDGSYHPVDSSAICFEIAGSHALTKGVRQANPTLIEPIMLIEITVPEASTGVVIGDLNSKRARILGMIPQGNGKTLIEADVPQAEILKYATNLRSITQGRGSYTIRFDRYEQVPAHLSQRIIEQTLREKEEARA